MVEHQHVARGFLRESVARGEDRADHAVHAVRIGFLAHLVAQPSVGERHQVEDLGAERIALQGVGAHRDHRLQCRHVGFLGVEARDQHQHLVQIGIRGQRLVVVLIGVSVIKIVVILVGQRRIARIVAQHQRRIVVGRFRIHRPVDDVVLVGDFGGGQRRNQEQQKQQSFHTGRF